MKPRIAYVFNKMPPAESAVAGDRPLTDYGYFCRQHHATQVALKNSFDRWNPLGRLGRLGLALNILQRRSGEFDAYVVTGDEVGLPLALASLLLLGRRRSPIHIIFHGHYIGSGKFAAAMKLLRRTRHVHWHPLSAALHRALTGRYRVPLANSHQTGHSVDTDFFHPVTRNGTVIASAGIAFRDYRTLVAATRGLDVPVKIAAHSPWYPGAVDIGPAGDAAHVEARSYESYRGLRELYADALIVVVPLQDRPHACGYAVIAEAMAMGKTVIATRTAAPSDFLIDGVNGYYVTAGDAEALRSRIRYCLDNPDATRALGAAARQTMLGFTLDAFSQRMASAVAASL